MQGGKCWEVGERQRRLHREEPWATVVCVGSQNVWGKGSGVPVPWQFDYSPSLSIQPHDMAQQACRQPGTTMLLHGTQTHTRGDALKDCAVLFSSPPQPLSCSPGT